MLKTNDSKVCYDLFSSQLGVFPKVSPILINTINQYSYCIAENDSEFKKALLESDVLLPDGISIVIVNRFLNGKIIKKIAGADIHKYYLEVLNKEAGKCFYLGSTSSTLEKIVIKINKEYPNIQVQTFSPPFKEEFTEDENVAMINAINSFKPDVLFVGMTAPKQEKWATQHKHEIQAKVICTIGAVFDFYAETIERPSKIWIDFGLEWFIRLVKEPKRMWKRYLYYGPVFVYKIIKEKLN